MRRDRAPADHLRQAGADDVVLQIDVEIAFVAELLRVIAELVENFGHAGTKRHLRAELPQLLIRQTAQRTVFDIAEQVIQINGVLGNMEPALGVQFGQAVDLDPEFRFVDTVRLEERRLHVTGRQRLVEVPDAGERVVRA